MQKRVDPVSLDEFQQISEKTQGFDIRQLQDFFSRRWKLILATAAVFLTVVFLIMLTITPRYTASTQILLEPHKDKSFGNDLIAPELNLDSSNVDSQISIIQSINLLRRVVEKQKLVNDAEFGQVRKPGWISLFTRLFYEPQAEPVFKAKPGADNDIPPDTLRAITTLKTSLEVARINRTYVITVSVTSEDPDKAARLANAIADTYVVDQLDARYDAAKRASDWLAERMEGLRDQVRGSEQAVIDYRKANNLVASSADGKITVTDQQLSELNGKLAGARADSAEKKAKYDQAQQLTAKGGNLQAIPDVVRSTVISDMRKQQSELARKEADLVSRYTEQHPQVVNTRAERRDLERSISNEVGRILSNLKNDYEVAKAREASLQASVTQAAGDTGNDTAVGIGLRELERTNSANKTLFENFLSKTKLTQEQSSLQEREARIISPASRPGFASFPRTSLVEALAALVGLGLGIAGGAAMDLLNAGFLTPREVEQKLGLPVLASIPVLKESERKIDGKSVSLPEYMIDKPLSRYAEAVRSIRIGVQLSDVDYPTKSILITSSVPQEGKTTLAISLAISAAKAGLRVVLVDCDLRHPSVTKFFNLGDRPGLVEMLTGAIDAKDPTLFTFAGMTVIPAGAKSQNPPDLLGSARMKQLVEKLSLAYDYVVIDSPPIGPVIDAKILSAIVDKTVFAVRWQTTIREAVAENIDTLNIGRRIAGVVLTQVDETKTSRYGKYGYYQGGYYNKYYSN